MLSGLVGAVSGQRGALDDAIAPFVQAASEAWSAAGKEARDHILAVVRNNPAKPIEEILGRWDVRQALKVTFDEAKSTAAEAVTGAWKAGKELGQVQADAQLESIGLAGQGKVTIAESVLKGTLSDLDKNADLARERIASAAAANDPKAAMSKATDVMARRAGYSAQTAGYTAHSLAQERAYAQAGAKAGGKVRKMWVTRFGPGTCPTCAALHGTVVDIGKPFPSKATFHPSWKPPKPYMGVLMGPPAHPNCRCFLIPFVTKMESERQGLLVAAEKWWAKVAKALGLGR